jgi:hypothetical protein
MRLSPARNLPTRLAQLRKNNPKQLFAKFAKKKKSQHNVSLLSFFYHFKSVSSASTLEGDTTYDNDTVYEELGLAISEQELEKTILGLKRDK